MLKTIGTFGGLALLFLMIIGGLGLLILKYTPVDKIINSGVDHMKPPPVDYTHSWKNKMAAHLVTTYCTDSVLYSDAFKALWAEFADQSGLEASSILKRMEHKVKMIIIDEYIDFTKLERLKNVNPKGYNSIYAIYEDYSDESMYLSGIDTRISRDVHKLYYDQRVVEKFATIIEKLKADIVTQAKVADQIKLNIAKHAKIEGRRKMIEARCDRVIAALAPVGVGFKAIGTGVGKVKSFLGRVKQGLKDILSVGWQLVKKKKSEACPYMYFHKGSDKPVETTKEP